MAEEFESLDYYMSIDENIGLFLDEQYIKCLERKMKEDSQNLVNANDYLAYEEIK